MARLYIYFFSLYVFMSLMSLKCMSTKAKNKKGAKNKTFETFVSSSVISSMITDPPILQYHFYQKNIAILLVMSPQNYYIFAFAEQALESSLLQLLDIIFGTIFPVPSTLGLLKNYSRILSSGIIYPNAKLRLDWRSCHVRVCVWYVFVVST